MTEKRRLAIPTIPRREEETTIHQALQEARNGKARVIFLGGAGGTGKSTLVDTALKTTGSGCRYGTTKFDQRKQNAPLEGMRQLISSLIGSIQENSCSRSSRALYTQLEDHQFELLKSFVTTKLTAALPVGEEEQQEIGPFDDSKEENKEETSSELDLSELDNHSVSSLSSTSSVPTDTGRVKDGLSILTSALKASLRAIGSVATVVLTLDDIQWSCPDTMTILEQIIRDPGLENILICATYRTEEETATEGFYEWKDQIERNTNPAIHNLSDKFRLDSVILNDLTLPQVQELLAEAINQEISQVFDLADTVFAFTHGNLLFMKHFLEKIQEDGLLTFDLLMYRWTWDTDEIKRRSSISDSIVQILSSRIYKLPKDVQNVLMLASCFGAQFDSRALEAVKSALDICCVKRPLQDALDQQFIIHLRDTHYRFAHDIIQITSYGLLPESLELQRVHWNIGCLLLERKDLLKTDSILFATVDNLNMADCECMGCHCPEMRKKLAEINYNAGRKAASFSAFIPASKYIRAGIDCLGGKPFELNYDLAIKLHQLAATTEYVVGNIDACQQVAQMVIDNSKTCKEKLPSMLIIYDCYIARDQTQELIEFCLKVLESAGERISRKPNAVQVQLEYQKMRMNLKSMSDSDLLGLPLIEEFEKDVALQVMYRMMLPSYQLEEVSLSMLVVCRMIGITLRYGLSAASPIAFVSAGTFIASHSHDIKEAYRLGNLAGQLGARLPEAKGASGQVIIMIANNTKWWFEPVSSGLDLFIRANEITMKYGILTEAFRSLLAYSTTYFYSGLPLGPLLQDVEKFCNQYKEYNQMLFFLLGSPMLQVLLNITGKSDNPSSMEEGVAMEERKSFPNPNKSGQQTIESLQMVLSFYLGDLPKATEMADKLARVKPGLMKSSFWYVSRRFYMALIAIANYRVTHKRHYRIEAEKHLKFYRIVVKEGAINLVHKLQLMEAEMMNTNTKMTDKQFEIIYDKYNDAIVSATRAGFLQDAALANYLMFQFITTSNKRTHLAELYLKRAFEGYIAWDAEAIADSLPQRHPAMFAGSSSLRDSLTDKSSRSSGTLRSRPRFDASLSLQHKELNVR